VDTAHGRQTTEEESAAVNPFALRLLREYAGLSDLFIATTCATGHWYTVKHVSFEHTAKDRNGKIFGAHTRLLYQGA
jgi:hypothetical protein